MIKNKKLFSENIKRFGVSFILLIGVIGVSATFAAFLLSKNTLNNKLGIDTASIAKESEKPNDILPITDLGGSLGAVNTRWLNTWSQHVNVGNPSDSHTNVLLKVGSGQTTRPDFPSIGTGSGFTSVYGAHFAPVFKWTGDSNGPATALTLLPTIMSDDISRKVGDFTVLSLTMPENVNGLESLSNSYGLTINYSKPSGVANAVPLKVTGGTSVFSAPLPTTNANLQVRDGSLLLTNSNFVNSDITLQVVGSHILGLKDVSGNASKFRVYTTSGNYLEMAQDGLRTSNGAINFLTSRETGWAIVQDGTLTPTGQNDIGSSLVPFGTTYGTRYTIWTAGQGKPKTDIQPGFLGFGPGGSSNLDVWLYRTGPGSVKLDKDGSEGPVSLTIAGTVTSKGETPNLTSCGTKPLIAGSNNAGTVTVGEGAASCTVLFSNSAPFANNPSCTITTQSGSVVSNFSYTHTASSIIVTGTGLGGTTFDYICLGH